MAHQERPQAGRAAATEVDRTRVTRVAVEAACELVVVAVVHHLERVVGIDDHQLVAPASAPQLRREPEVGGVLPTERRDPEVRRTATHAWAGPT
jgi:hypothetical protein